MTQAMEEALKKALAIDADRQLQERTDNDWTGADRWADQVIKLLRQAVLYRFPVGQMGDDEIKAELEFLSLYFDDCAAIGQGISSKDAVRQRQLIAEQERRRP